MKKKYPRVLAIAGSDSGGGAGIQADIKAISATGSYASTAITAVTVQNTLGVSGIHLIPAEIIRGQIEAVLSDIGADSVKIGMLASPETVIAVKEALCAYDFTNIVLDPVMVATSGDVLSNSKTVDCMVSVLVPMARIITPNIPEAEVLLDHGIDSASDLCAAARTLSRDGKISVLLKGGHLEGPSVTDILYNAVEDSFTEFTFPRIDTPNTHGTGCTLSSAIASFLAKGLPLEKAVASAEDYISKAISLGSAYTIGKGHGPVSHFLR